MPPYIHRRMAADGLVAQRGAVYHGGVLLASAGGAATVNVYDGLDTSGELIDSYRAATSDRDVHVLEVGLAINTGLYVDLGSNVSACTIYFDLPTGAER